MSVQRKPREFQFAGGSLKNTRSCRESYFALSIYLSANNRVLSSSLSLSLSLLSSLENRCDQLWAGPVAANQRVHIYAHTCDRMRTRVYCMRSARIYIAFTGKATNLSFSAVERFTSNLDKLLIAQ